MVSESLNKTRLLPPEVCGRTRLNPVDSVESKAARSGVRLLGALLFLLGVQAHAQVSLEHFIQRANAYHPSLRVAKLSFEASKQDVEAIKRRRWPSLTLVAEAASTEKGSIPTQQLGVEQILWDFGALATKIEESDRVALVAELLISSERRKVHLEVANAWQALLGAIERKAVARSSLETLQVYKEMMSRRVAAEVSPSIDLEVVQSRIMAVQVDLAQAKNSITVALIKLRQLGAIEELSETQMEFAAMQDLFGVEEFKQSLVGRKWRDEVDHHPNVVRAKFEVQLSELRLKVKKTEQWPQVYARVTQPIDSGSGAANDRNMQGTAFLGLRYSPGAGFSSSAEVAAMATRLASTQQAIDIARNEVMESLALDVADFESNWQRHTAQIHAVQSSKKVLESYQTQFVAGRKSWQEVLNAVREMSASQYAERDAWVGLTGAMQRIRAKTGVFERMYE